MPGQFKVSFNVFPPQERIFELFLLKTVSHNLGENDRIAKQN